MIELIFSICFTASMGIWFKEAQRRTIPIQPLIFVNYLVCVLFGNALSPRGNALSLLNHPAAVFAIPQGALLIINFYLLGITCQRAGVGLAAFASRSGVLVPAALSFLFFGETLTLLKIAGLAGAVTSLRLVLCEGGRSTHRQPREASLLMAATFLSYGVYFLLLKWVQIGYLSNDEHHAYLGLCFGLAAALGIGPLVTGRVGVSAQSFIWGIGIGVCNYGSIFLILAALEKPGFSASFVLPVFASGTVILSTVIGRFLYAERLSSRKLWGIAVALCSIPLLV